MYHGHFWFMRRRQGRFIETRWFWFRWYPGTLPRWTFTLCRKRKR